jgi:hypothetical protein
MSFRCLLVIGFSVLALSQTHGGFVAKDTGKPDAPGRQPQAGVEDEKALLGRLVAQLERSSRSFIYLRSIGFAQSDEEFEKLIVRNNKILESTRIMRFDAQGNRQIPGWPGVRLTAEFKSQPH